MASAREGTVDGGRSNVVSLRDLVSEVQMVNEFPGLFSRKALQAMRRRGELRWIDGEDGVFYPRQDIDKIVNRQLKGRDPDQWESATQPSNTPASGSTKSTQTAPGIAIGSKDAASAAAALAKGI